MAGMTLFISSRCSEYNKIIFMTFLSLTVFIIARVVVYYRIHCQCLQLVRIRPYLYGFYVVCMDIQ